MSEDHEPQTSTQPSDANESGLKDALAAARGQAAGAAQAPLREELISNAIGFLTSPKVVGSTAGAKRSFLKGKGLADAEIDEAVKRAAPLIQTVQPASDAQVAHASQQPINQVPSQVHQQPTSVIVAPPLRRTTWTQKGASTLLVLCALYGVATFLTPHVKRLWKYYSEGQWYGPDGAEENSRILQLISNFSSRQEETAKEVKEVVLAVHEIKEQANKDDASAASEVLQGNIDELRSEVSKLRTAMGAATGLSQDISDIRSMLQQQSLQSDRSSPEVMSRLKQLPADDASAPYYSRVSPAGTYTAGDRATAGASTTSLGSNNSRHGSRMGLGPRNLEPMSPRSRFAAASSNPGEALAGLRSMSTGIGSNSVAALDGGLEGGGWGASLGMSSNLPKRTSGLDTGPGGMRGGAQVLDASDTSSMHSEPQKPADYLNILQMLERGETPPGIRTDIVDKPPTSGISPTPSAAARQQKPWQASGAAQNANLEDALMQASTAPRSPTRNLFNPHPPPPHFSAEAGTDIQDTPFVTPGEELAEDIGYESGSARRLAASSVADPSAVENEKENEIADTPNQPEKA